ncbi:D-TA family PLP-dependent enzyme [Rhodovibrio salinarum]|uniref:Alanine racemase n=1 Tax=Rhodovibrio salinarum TaxID=1087 RepID=A0A934UZ09_9PROT|nr:D-TA family PLP-dependent enzyme [Rhodovibrio salinarum]MBK1696597.1 alanine racemase [Rhodovibrio salinarum]
MHNLAAVETPAAVVDLDRVEANLARAQAYADAHRLRLRPHIKTHKLPRFARRQVALGAVGITCQKLGEAEVMADAGIDDILLTYNILGASKLQRLRNLAHRISLTVTADNVATVQGYASAFEGAEQPLTVLVECDTGAGRCGVQTPAELVQLAHAIETSPGLTFGGIMTYPPKRRVGETAQWLAEAVNALEGAGLPPATVTSGGTPDMWSAHLADPITEYRPGTYIYLDRMQVDYGVGSLDDCALTVLTTVVSTPTPDRAILDAGSKALTTDMLGQTGFGLIREYPDAVIGELSEEHGIVDVSRCATKPTIGERLRVVPNHACVVSNLFERVQVLAPDGSVEEVPVAARGRVV